MMTSKQLWDDAYLDRFAKSLHEGCPIQFWSYNKDGELEDFKPNTLKPMQKFFPQAWHSQLARSTNKKWTVLGAKHNLYLREVV